MRKGIQTKKERKYVSSVVQIPMSSCAQVPAKTRKMSNASSVTVSRSEAKGLMTLRSVAFTDVPLCSGRSALEAQAAREAGEGVALAADERVRTGHLDEIGEVRAWHEDDEHALPGVGRS